MEKQQSEVDKFFGDLPSEDKKVADVFEDKKPEPKVPEKDEEEGLEEDESEVRKNRRHRRLEEQLQKERDSNIALNERIKVLSEVSQFKKSISTDDSIDPRLVEIFGPTDEGKKIAKHLSEILEEKTEIAREKAIQEMEERQSRVIQEQKQYESLIDSELEALEDKHNIDLTSDSPQARKARREFLEMVQNLSPKDEDGTITGYADFDSTFDLYRQTRERPQSNDRQKEIASRSMQRSGGTTGQPQYEGPMSFDRAREQINKQFTN